MLFLRAVWATGSGEIVAFLEAGSVPAGPLLIVVFTRLETDLVALVVFDAEVGAAVPEEIVENPETTFVVEAEEVERACVIVAGVGIREAADDLAGSSKEGGGKIGFDDDFPVPDGPPPPVRRRGVEPAAPVAALKACCTICCCRARTSLPLVT